MKKAIYMLAVVSLLFACSEEDGDSPVFPFKGKEYAGLVVGQESIYQIDSTLYDEFSGLVKQVSLQRREYVLRTELDAANRETFIVEIYTRSADTLPWRFNRVTKRVVTEFRYEVLDQNVLSVPLVFPIAVDKSWDSNTLNASIPKEYSYTSVNEPFVDGALSYDSTVTVLQFEEENLIEQLFEEEIYATQMWLVYREHKEIETELNGDIRSGFESIQRLISFKR